MVICKVINLFDLYTQYANCEGFGLPQVEAAACGVPVCGTDYSAMESVLRKLEGHPIKPAALYKELETGCLRAVPDNDATAKFFLEFFSKSQEERDAIGKKTRENFEKYYQWDISGKQWEDYFDSVEIPPFDQGWGSPPKIHQPAPKPDVGDGINTNQISKWLISMCWIISVMIVVGGLTRLTDSGLSITQWQLFSGFFPPLNNSEWIMYFDLYKKIPEFKLQNYDMSMQEFKVIFWWEWAHRFMGRLIGISFLIPLIYFTFKIQFKKLISLYFIFTLICVQGFIGWYMVSSGLIDRVDVSHFRLSVHLLMAFFILSLIFWNYLKIKIKKNFQNTINIIFPIIFLFLVFLQISIGAFVSGMDAGKIYNSWPLMGNSIFPNDNSISNLFRLSAFSDPSLVQFIHRKLAYLIGFFYLYLLFYIYKNKKSDLYVSVNVLGFFIILQIVLGIFTLLYGAQILIASMHQISSIFLVASCIYFLFINTKSNLQLSS